MLTPFVGFVIFSLCIHIWCVIHYLSYLVHIRYLGDNGRGGQYREDLNI